MMGKTDNQMQMIIFDIDSIIPQNHLLRQIKNEMLTLLWMIFGGYSIRSIFNCCKSQYLNVQIYIFILLFTIAYFVCVLLMHIK